MNFENLKVAWAATMACSTVALPPSISSAFPISQPSSRLLFPAYTNLPCSITSSIRAQSQTHQQKPCSSPSSFQQPSPSPQSHNHASETPNSTMELPSLPENSPHISSHLWDWKDRWLVHYETAGTHNVGAPALLLLPGFGVGSFHYENQLRGLGQKYRVWAMDFFGQGRSWPSHDPAPPLYGVSPESGSQLWGFGPQLESWAKELVFSVDLWRNQIFDFVTRVIGEPVYIAGNSLGGFVGVYFTVKYPHLVRGITLMNATPFWAFIPNAIRSPWFARLVPWAGELPVPLIARLIARFGWKQLQNPKRISMLLQLVYVDHSVLSEDLIMRIVEATDHPAAAAAFSSIIFAPQAEFSFNEGLKRCRENSVPVCLIYGKEDPWVVPLWGQRVKQLVPEAVYYEISPAGHCPHHEVPEVVNFLLQGWIENLESEGFTSLPLYRHCEAGNVLPLWTMTYNRRGVSQSVNVRVVTKAPSAWAYLVSLFSSIFVKFRMLKI